MALGRLELLKSNLFTGEDGGGFDAELTMALVEASDIIQSLVGRELLLTTYTDEYWVGDGTDRWYPQRSPIVSVASITFAVGGASAGSYELCDPVYLRGAAIGFKYIRYLMAGSWQHNLESDITTVGPYDGGWVRNQGYKITYNAGYDDTNWDTAAATFAAVIGVPDDLEYACCDLAHKLWMEGVGSRRSRRGISRIDRGAEGISIESFGSLISASTERVIQKYRHIL